AAPHQRLDAFDQLVARVDVDAGFAIGHRSGCGRGLAGHDDSLAGESADFSSRDGLAAAGRGGSFRAAGGDRGNSRHAFVAPFPLACRQDGTMQRTIRNRWAWATGLLLATMLVATGAQAQRVEGDRAVARGLYATEVSVNSQSEADRKAG